MKKLIPLRKFGKMHAWPDYYAIKWLMNRNNPLSQSFRPCTVKIGRFSYIDPDLFYQWITDQGFQNRLTIAPRINQAKRKEMERAAKLDNISKIENVEKLETIPEPAPAPKQSAAQLMLDVFGSPSDEKRRDMEKLSHKKNLIMKCAKAIIWSAASGKKENCDFLARFMDRLESHDPLKDGPITNPFYEYFIIDR